MRHPPAGAPAPEPEPVPEGHVRLTIDGVSVIAPKGELVIRTAERIGIAIPRFCDHPLLEPVGACRQCLVEVEMGGRPMPKPQASCTQTVADGMVVKTQLTSPVAEKAQRSNLEFLLLNHPLDCPICDKGGECPLQNQTLANGSAVSRLRDPKRVFVKPIAVSTEILLDRERCVLCQRCTRFSDQIAGDKFIDLLERGSAQQIGINSDRAVPVVLLRQHHPDLPGRRADLGGLPVPGPAVRPGLHRHGLRALRQRLRAAHRPPGRRRHPAAGPHRPRRQRGVELRQGPVRLPLRSRGRPAHPPAGPRRRRRAAAEASWTEAMAVAARGLLAARDNGGVGVLTGGRLTVTDAYAYAKFARLALRTNDIDFRARAHSAEEAAFLAARVAGTSPERGGVTYAGLEKASVVLLVALEPEEESPILFLRLRKAARKGLPCSRCRPLLSAGLHKMSGTLVGAVPGTEPTVLAGLAGETLADAGVPDAAERNRLGAAAAHAGCRRAGGRAGCADPGLLTAVAAAHSSTRPAPSWPGYRGGRVNVVRWTPARSATLLPGGRPLADPAARAEVETAWGASIPEVPGRDTAGILAAVGIAEPDSRREEAAAEPAEPRGLAGLLIGGVEISDLPDPAAALGRGGQRRFRGQPGDPGERRDRTGRRGVPGRRRGGEVGRVRELGGPAAAVRRRAARGRDARRGPDPGHPRRGDGRRPVHPDGGRRGRRDGPAGRLERASRVLHRRPGPARC